MFNLEALDLARMQFAFTVSFHIIFPAITIGLASFLAVLEGLWLKTHNDTYRDLYHFWSKIFAVNFGMGVVSGLVMAYEFGTNWSRFSDFAGSITGPLLTYEVLTAFFLEAGFLGVMLFGWNRVGRGLHFFSTVMVAIGTLISTFWILASNSWMQTPQGFEIVDGRVMPLDWLAIVFNPSFPYRLAHMAIAAFVATAFFVGSSAAWHLLRGNDTKQVRKMLSMALWMALIVAPIQAVVGDAHGLNTLEHQPAKIAAIEGHWENNGSEATPLVLFGIPDMQAEKTRYAIEIPYLGSLILTHSLDKQIPALKSFPERGPAECDGGLLEFPRHGRAGHVDGAGRRARPGPAPQRRHLPQSLVPAPDAVDGASGLDRHAGRVDHHRSRASAVGGVWPVAYRRCRVQSQCRAVEHLAGAVRGDLFLGVHGGHRLHDETGRQRAAAASRACRRRAFRSGHHTAPAAVRRR